MMLKLLGNDDYLHDIHAFMLMDDTVLLASSRKKIIEKFTVLMKFCKDNGMLINELKTKLMVVNGVGIDRCDFTVEDVVVRHTTSYIYLGSPFTEDGRISSVIGIHVKAKTSDLNKFKIFCKKNESMPYQYKKNVFDAVLMQRLLYGCESWLIDQNKELEKLYLSAVKSLLGVRETTRNDTCLIEVGLPTMRELIRKKTKNFVMKYLNMENGDDIPFRKVYRLCQEKQTKGFKFLSKLSHDDPSIGLTVKFQREKGTKAITYKEINPQLKVHQVYLSKEYIDEKKRINLYATSTKLP